MRRVTVCFNGLVRQVRFNSKASLVRMCLREEITKSSLVVTRTVNPEVPRDRYVGRFIVAGR